ncbi:MAG: MerR family transcriptional regulator [Xanthobacteraceae bacterium]
MDKAPDAFRTISEVAEEINVPQHVLRFWESRFAQIRPLKRGGGRRYYRPDDVDLLRGVRHLLYGEGYTIRGVQRILREQGLTFVQMVWRAGAEPPPPELEEDRVGDDGAEPHAATSADEELAVPVTAAPRPGRAAHATQPAPPRLNVNTEGRRKLQTVLDDLIACRRLIDDALADASSPHAD